MINARLSNFIVALMSVILLPWGVASCGSDPGARASRDTTGNVAMPFITTSGGHIYRLSNVIIDVTGPVTTQLTVTNPGEIALTATLQAGDYDANLAQWTLEKADSEGVFAPVHATLVSPQIVSFSVFGGGTTNIVYLFETDGIILVIGQGTVKVNIGVTEVSPICTPLGGGCFVGTWCAPSELTGAPLGCIAYGTTPIGSSCGTPTECPQNASCFDLGYGEICAELCDVSMIGGPCFSGTMCESVGATTYGVCRPF